MRVSDAMTSAPIAIPAHTPVRDALALLATMEVRHLPVTDARGALLGLVSERDLHSFYAARPELAGNWAHEVQRRLEDPIASVMTKEPVVVGDDAPLAHAIDTMIGEKVGALPVVHNGKLVGIVSYVDLLKVLAGMLRQP